MSFQTILVIALLNIVYLIGFFGLSIWLNVTETEYFLGRNPKLIRFQIRNVTFHIGWYIPIVGLSPIYTLVDGQQRMKYPWEFQQHSLGRRLLATYGGAFGLIIAGIIISIGQYYTMMDSFITKEEVNRLGIYPSEAALEAGFMPGDQITAINGKDYQKYEDLLNPRVVVQPEVKYTVLRDGKEIEITVVDMVQKLFVNGQPFLALLAPFEVLTVESGSPADQAGIKPGDMITKVNGQPVIKYTEMTHAFQADGDGRVSIQVKRPTNDSPETRTLDVTLNDDRRIGIVPKELINYKTMKHSFGEALLKGPGTAFIRLWINIRAFTRVIIGTRSSRESVNGPIHITSTSTNVFWMFAGIYALWWAFWNLLLLPKSAFLEVIALVYEGLTKKKYPYKAYQRSTTLSWIPLGVLAVWIFVGDIIKLF